MAFWYSEQNTFTLILHLFPGQNEKLYEQKNWETKCHLFETTRQVELEDDHITFSIN